MAASTTTRDNIGSFLEASTGHLERESIARDLQDGRFPSPTYPEHDQGAVFVHVPAHETALGEVQRLYEQVHRQDMPESLLRLMRLAREHGCTYIRFDPCAPAVEGVPTHSW